MFQFHDRYTVSHNGDFHVVLDELRSPKADGSFDQMLFLHIDFYDFTKSSLQRALREWATFRSIVTAPIFAFCSDAEDDPDKWARFVRLLGFDEIPDASVPASDGSSRRIFVSHEANNGSEDPIHHEQQSDC